MWQQETGLVEGRGWGKVMRLDCVYVEMGGERRWREVEDGGRGGDLRWRVVE